MATEKYSNNASSTLSGSINSSVTSLTVASAANFPTTGQFRILVDSELMLVTGVASNVFTVTRGSELTTAASHTGGAVVTHILTAGALDQLRSNDCDFAAYASRPAAEKDGRIFLPTNGHALYRDNASDHVPWGPLFPLKKPPALSAFTAVNSATAVETYGGIYIAHSGVSGNSVKGFLKAAPTPPYSIDVAFLFNMPASSYQTAGFLWGENSTGKLVQYGLQHESGAPFSYLAASKFTNSTTYNSSYNWAHGGGTLVVNGSFNGLLFLQFNDDGTSLKTVKMSGDGVNFVTIQSIARTDFFTPDRVGFGLNNTQTIYPIGMTLIHWYEH